jgi:iron(III) transport system permease protein
VYTLYGMVLVQGLAIVPFAYLMIAASFRMVDPSLEQAARVAGGSFPMSIRRITLPLVWPALLGAAIYYGVWVLETFEIPITLGLPAQKPVMSTQIYYLSNPRGGGLPNYAEASVHAVLLVITGVVLTFFYRRATRAGEKYVTVTGKAWRADRVSLGRARPWVALLGCGYVLVAVAVPMVMLVWTSLFPFYRPPSREALSFARLTAYENVTHYPGVGQVLLNTLVMAGVAALVTCLLCVLVAWNVVRPPVGTRWTRWLDQLSFLPLTIPSLVIGLAFIFGYARTPIYGTVAILVVALTTKFLAYGSRALIAAVRQVSPELEEQATISGAGRIRVLRKVLLPLLAPALANVAFYAAIVSVRELAMVLMLYTPGSRVVSTLVWQFWVAGQIGYACALGVLMSLMLGLLYFGSVFLTRRLSNRVAAD